LRRALSKAVLALKKGVDYARKYVV
jgi:hypothetical protein